MRPHQLHTVVGPLNDMLSATLLFCYSVGEDNLLTYTVDYT